MNLKVLASLISIVFCYSVWPSGHYPKVIQQIIDTQAKQCKQQSKGQLIIANHAIQSIRLNSDKEKDYLVDDSGFECTTNTDMTAGSLPIRIRVYLSHKKGWKMAWSGTVMAYTFDKKEARLVLEVIDENDKSKVVKKFLKVEKNKVTLAAAPA